MRKNVLIVFVFSCLIQGIEAQVDSVKLKVSAVLKELSVEEKIDLLCARAPAFERLSMPAYDWWSECLHGVARAGKATVFPKPIALGSMWDVELLNEIAVAISDEARAKYHKTLAQKGYTERYEGLTYFSPTLNIARDPRWGRTSECFSEDPYLTSQLGVSFIKGLQGEKEGHLKLVATSKHFVANNEENRRNSGSAEVDELSLREYYFPAFEASVKDGKVASVMAAYNALNGVPCTSNSFLLEEVLRKEWGFDGVTISDGSAVEKIYTHHKYKENLAEASAAALLAGCNMSLRDEYREGLREAYAQKLVAEKDLDEAVRHVLELRVRLGMFDSYFTSPYATISENVVECEKHQKLAQKAAEKSIILLKNDGVLPINYLGKKIALIGDAFNKVYYGDYSGMPEHNYTLLDVLKKEIGNKAKLMWISDFSEEEEIIPSACFLREAIYDYEGRLGLTGEYFLNPDLTGEPVLKQHDLTLDVSTDRKVFASNTIGISARWHSALIAPETGIYKLYFKGASDVKLYLNGKLILDQTVRKIKASVEVKLEAQKENQLVIEARNMQKNGHYALSWEIPRKKQTESPESVAASSDLAVVFIRDDRASEGKDRTTLAMTDHQKTFVEKIIQANPNTVVIVGASTPLLLKEVAKKSAALLNIWIAGQGEAQALSNILLGKVNPSGKTPVTFVVDENELPPLDDYNMKNGRSYQYFKGNVLFPFGYGLSYTTFKYGKPIVEQERISKKEYLRVVTPITNTGNMDGEEVVQCYVNSPLWSDLNRKLVAFKRVFIPKGKTVNITIDIPTSSLKRWSVQKHTWQVLEGSYELHVVPNAGASNSCSFRVD